eukprot:560459_1
MSTYTWKITDPSLMRSMKNAKNEVKWKSPVFSIGGFRWYLKVYPNGDRVVDNGYVSLYLHLAFLPPKAKSLSIGQESRLIETDTMYSVGGATYDKDHMSWGSPKTLKTENIQNLTTLTFSVKIDICGVIDHEDDDVTNQYINIIDEESKEMTQTRLDSLTTYVEKLVNDFQSLKQQLTDVEERIDGMALDHRQQITTYPRASNSANTNNGRKRKLEQENDNSNEPPRKKLRLDSNVKDKSKMSAKEVADWMGALGPAYKQYMDRCIEHAIDGCLMNELDEQSLTEIVTNKIHIKKIIIGWNKL